MSKITTKQDLKDYISADLTVQPEKNGIVNYFLHNQIVHFKLHLRKCEYHHNVKQNMWHRIWYAYHYFSMKRILKANCSEIPINVFGKGLTIWHLQRIIVNANSSVGDYCSITSGVVIAQAHNLCPKIGNHVEITIDAKILGDIQVADHVRIGAGALVIKDILEPNTTWGGVPAKLISHRGTIETPIPVA